jgi:hypothetical protein
MTAIAIFAGLAEFDRELIVERTRPGLGVHGPRLPVPQLPVVSAVIPLCHPAFQDDIGQAHARRQCNLNLSVISITENAS